MITLNDIKKPLRFKISSALSGVSISDVVENHYGDTWDFDVYLPSIGKNLQRPLVWTLHQKQQLVISVFKDVYIPPICVVRHKTAPGSTHGLLYQVIDGKQRLNAMLGFYKNEFPIEVNGTLYFFQDLSKDLQQLYGRYNFVHSIVYHYDYSEEAKITDADKIAWFEMINFAGTAQDIEHLNSLKSN